MGPSATNLGRIFTAANGLGAGFTANPSLTGSTLSASTTFTGSGLTGADAIRVQVNTQSAFGVKVQNAAGTATYADASFAAGNTTHWFPLYTPLPAGNVKVVVTPTTGTVTLTGIEFKNNPFVTVETTATTTSSVTATVGAFPESGLNGYLRAIPADQASNCAGCSSVALPITSGRTYTMNGLTAGSWRLVMYINTPQETLGTSPDFIIEDATWTPGPILIPPTTTSTTTAPPTTAAATTTSPPSNINIGQVFRVVDFGIVPGATPDPNDGCFHVSTGGGQSDLNMPAEAWNASKIILQASSPNNGSEGMYASQYVVYKTAAGQVKTKSAPWENFNTLGDRSWNHARLIKLDAGDRVLAWSLSSVWICLPPTFSINPRTLQNEAGPSAHHFTAWLSVPNWPSGTHEAIPVIYNPPGTGPAPTNPVSPPMGLEANYLRSAFTDTTAGDVCLQPGSGNVQVGSCISGTQPLLNLTFVPYNVNQFRIKPLGQPGTCLQISDRDHPFAVDAAAGNRFALIAQWGACENPYTTRPGHNGFLDSLFTFTETRAGWYGIKPAQNYANWTDPCLSIWASTNNGDTSGNILNNGYGTPVMQYTCQGTNPAWQQWAPIETNGYTYPANCTSNCPPSPDGAHTLQAGVETILERKTDLACIRTSGDLALPLIGNDCRSFVPETAGTGWLLRDATNRDSCLARISNGFTVGMALCSTAAIWDDKPIQTDGLTFPLVNTSVGLCLGGTTTPILEKCSGPLLSDHLWYDQPGLQDRLASKYWEIYSSLISEYLELPLRAATVPEIKAFAAAAGKNWLTYVHGDIRNSWWVIVDPNGYAVSAKLDENLIDGTFWSDPSFWLSKNSMALKIQAGAVQVSNTPVSQAVGNYLCLIRSLCTVQQVRVAEQTHGLARVEMSNSIFASVFWDQVSRDAAIAILGLLALAKGVALRNYGGSITAATKARGNQ